MGQGEKAKIKKINDPYYNFKELNGDLTKISAEMQNVCKENRLIINIGEDNKQQNKTLLYES